MEIKKNNLGEIKIKALRNEDQIQFLAHQERHRAESGRTDSYFMPFDPDCSDSPKGVDIKSLKWSFTEPGWQRWFIAVSDKGEIIGHVSLKGSELKTGLHRCELGIGIEKPYQGIGLGRKLMKKAIPLMISQWY